jgi:tetratricopeptide (TPR) repeat protein
VNPVRSVISVSALLAVATFVVVLVFAPMPQRGRGPVFVPASVEDQAARMRRALAEGRHAAAVSIANQTTEQFPDDPEAWLWQVQVQHALGHEAGARVAAEQLLRVTESRPLPAGPLTQSVRSYRLGWANWALSRQDAARAHFADAAHLYALSSEGAVEEAVRQYNLASFFSMSGDPDRAAEHFALAVNANYRADAGWWKVDPDLDPIRTQRAFLDAGVVLERREAERERRRNQRMDSPLAPPEPPEPQESPAITPPNSRAQPPEDPAPRS